MYYLSSAEGAHWDARARKLLGRRRAWAAHGRGRHGAALMTGVLLDGF